jgi:hypothetical protein
MKKIRLIRTTIIEYIPDPDYYDEGITIEQMAEVDINSDDRDALFERECTDEVRYEIFEG